MIKIGQIVEGHYNELTNKEEDLFNERMEICNKCPLMIEKSYGKVCNSDLYLNLKTGKLHKDTCEDCVRGCSCRLSAKTRVPSSKCPAGKW